MQLYRVGNSSGCMPFKKNSTAAFVFHFCLSYLFISISHLITFFLMLFLHVRISHGRPSIGRALPWRLRDLLRLRNPSPPLSHALLSLRSSIPLSGYSFLLSLSFSSFTPPLPRLYLAHSRYSRLVLRPLLPRQKFLRRDASFQFFPSLAFPFSLPLFSGLPSSPPFYSFLLLPF